MSTLEATISATLLPELEGVTAHEKWLSCAREYPWYPLPWVMLAKEKESEFIQKANLFFAGEQRLHWVLNNNTRQEDRWLLENLAITLEKNNENIGEEEVTKTYEGEEEEEIQINSTENNFLNPAFSYDLNKTNSDQYEKDELEANNTDYQEPVGDDEPSPLIEKAEVNAAVQSPVVGIADADLGKTITEGSVPTSAEEQVPEQAKPEPLVFEPFYSVDYFASQGIKLENNAEPKDKFDRQLKSFTQWLKTMKKVTVQETAVAADPVVDAQAMQSNSGETVITEAMAHVLEKQGKYEKAAAIYQKLMLLHPEKSVFFAAQIEDLKNKQ